LAPPETLALPAAAGLYLPVLSTNYSMLMHTTSASSILMSILLMVPTVAGLVSPSADKIISDHPEI